MANTPVVYSENDRHALLMSIASLVKKQIEENPNHGYYEHPEHQALDVITVHTPPK